MCRAAFIDTGTNFAVPRLLGALQALGLAVDAVQLVRLPLRATVAEARKAGAAIGARMGKGAVTVVAGNHRSAADIALGIALRGYDFGVYKSADKDGAGAPEADESPAMPDCADYWLCQKLFDWFGLDWLAENAEDRPRTR